MMTMAVVGGDSDHLTGQVASCQSLLNIPGSAPCLLCWKPYPSHRPRAMHMNIGSGCCPEQWQWVSYATVEFAWAHFLTSTCLRVRIIGYLISAVQELAYILEGSPTPLFNMTSVTAMTAKTSKQLFWLTWTWIVITAMTFVTSCNLQNSLAKWQAKLS